MFLFSLAVLYLAVPPAQPHTIPRNMSHLVEEIEEFRKKLVDMPDDFFDVELDINLLVTQTNDTLIHDEATAFRKKIAGMPGELFDLELSINRLTESGDSDGHDTDDTDSDTSCGVWHLGMNLNPADGHVMGYSTGWADDDSIGSDDKALTMDYLNRFVWTEPADYIAIVRHQHGVVDAVKVFAFKHWGLSLSHRFKDMDPGRMVVSEGGPVQEDVAEDAANLGDDPIFSVGGDLAFNWGYDQNGARLVLTGGHLSDIDDDNTHGLGNSFAVNPLTGKDSYVEWAHEISNIQDCPYPSCTHVHGVKLQGTDHGTGSTLKSGPVYGNYAIFVSQDAERFPGPGSKLGLVMEHCY